MKYFRYFLTILFLSLLVLTFFVGFVTAADVQTLGTAKQNDCIQLIQTCGNCSQVNISSIQYPNQSQVILQVIMQKSGSTYNYTFCNTQDSGQYIYNTIGDPDGIVTVQPVNFFISATGKDLTSAKATAYVIIFIISFIIFLGFLLLGIYLPSNNKTNEMTGYIIAVNNLKYLKLLFLSFAYLTAVFIAYLSWMISYSYLDMDFLTRLLQFLFFAEAIAILPLFILAIYFLISNWIRDTKVEELLSRGLSTRGEE